MMFLRRARNMSFLSPSVVLAMPRSGISGCLDGWPQCHFFSKCLMPDWSAIMVKTKSEMPAVLFDLDGTLIDSVYEHVEAWWSTLSQAGIQVPKWMIHRRIGMSGKSFITELLRELAPKKKVNIDELEAEHDSRIVDTVSLIQPLPGADELIKHLHRSKIRVALATTGNRKQTRLLLKKLTIPRGVPILTGD